jgi:hypothetical protein
MRKAVPNGNTCKRPQDTPPGDETSFTAGLLARGFWPSSRLPNAIGRWPGGISGCVGRWLAAYSCGGSAGFVIADLPVFPLSSRCRIPENRVLKM